MAARSFQLILDLAHKRMKQPITSFLGNALIYRQVAAEFEGALQLAGFRGDRLSVWGLQASSLLCL